MAVTNIPNVQNWTVTPQNGQAGYFGLMNTWLGQSTLVIASLQTAITAQNIANNQINALAIQAENNAIIATGLANFQGAYSTSVTYSKGQSVEYPSGSKIYYTSKVDNNLNHALTDTNYWLYSPINDKLDKDFSLLTDKATPADTDIFAIIETGGLLKKLSWTNLKTTLKTYFDLSYVALTGNQTIAGIKTFSSSPVVPTAAAGSNNTNAASTAFCTSQDLGVGQTWQNVTASRVLGTTYTNTTSKPIFVVFVCQGSNSVAPQGMSINIDGRGICNSNNTYSNSALYQGYTVTLACIVPSGSTYSYTSTVAPTSYTTYELR